jgi:isopentenyl-diphosphate Delta-isomerase
MTTPGNAVTNALASTRVAPARSAPHDQAAPATLITGVAADGSLYPIEKMQAHRDAALHLAVSVFVFDGPALLIQRRAAGKYHCGGLWANSCCSHPDWTESLPAAAARRLREELSITLALKPGPVLDYEADVSDGLREVERVQVFSAHVARAGLALAPDPAEVDAVDWVEVAVLQRDALIRPWRYAPWFRIYLDRWAELGFAPA